MDELQYLVENDCKSTARKSCWESVLKIHPYTGNIRCYDSNDLQLDPKYMGFDFNHEAIPFLRNEIFARKGFIFKTKQMTNFFSEMHWYLPKYQEVHLSKVEEWNVNFIREVEREIEADQELEQARDKLVRIYDRLKATCPINEKADLVK